jgi:hypothetical protein
MPAVAIAFIMTKTSAIAKMVMLMMFGWLIIVGFVRKKGAKRIL